MTRPPGVLGSLFRPEPSLDTEVLAANMSDDPTLFSLEDFLLAGPLANDEEVRQRLLQVANAMRSASNELSPQ